MLLLMAAILGVPVSALAYLFLAAANKLQKWLYTSLPGDIGLKAVPAWWPFPLLIIGGLLVAMAIKYLPGTGGHEPADGFKVGGVAKAAELPGIALAALITLGCGAVLGPEAPLVALGGGLCAWAVSHALKGDKSQAVVVLAAAGSFAAISTLLGTPLVGAFLLMEAAGLSSSMLELVLLPGLLAAGIGALVFTGLDSWTGLGTFSLALPGLPSFGRPNLAEFGWAIVIGLAAGAAVALIRRLALAVRPPAERRILIRTPLAGVVIAGMAVLFSQVTGKSTAYVLFSGQNELAPFVLHRAEFGLAAVCLLLASKGVAYGVSLATFRGGPVFPSIFLGAAGGVALSHLPGLPAIAAIGMGMGAMLAAMLRLPLTAALLAVLLLASDAAAVTPLVIVAVVVAYIAAEHLDPRAADAKQEPATAAAMHSSTALRADRPASS
jgi:H+/Cl- antiporter ClcA